MRRTGCQFGGTCPPRGIYLHIHGGGGAADQQDPRLERFADKGLAANSAAYRLAPEDPYPAAPDDCAAAALWLVHEARRASAMRGSRSAANRPARTSR